MTVRYTVKYLETYEGMWRAPGAVRFFFWGLFLPRVSAILRIQHSQFTVAHSAVTPDKHSAVRLASHPNGFSRLSLSCDVGGPVLRSSAGPAIERGPIPRDSAALSRMFIVSHRLTQFCGTFLDRPKLSRTSAARRVGGDLRTPI